MKILLIHQYYLESDDAGGSRFNEMTKVWAERGHSITVLAGMVNGATGEKNKKYRGKLFYSDQLDDNIKVIRSYTSSAYNIGFIGRFWGYVSFMFSSIASGLFIARQKYDVILVTSPPLFVGISALVLAKMKRISYVFEVRDLWPESAIDTGVLTNRAIIKLSYKVENILYKKAKLINVLTPAFRNNLIEKKYIPSEKIHYLPNASDFLLSDHILSTFNRDTFRKNLGISNKFVLIYVGAHGVANHLIQLIDVADTLRDENVQLILIGNGMTKPQLIEESGRRGLNNITFLDPVPKNEIFKYILASDVGVSVLKKVDTFKTIYSNKTFDYMACKRPVLMVIDGISRTLVEDAKCGIYAEPEDPPSIKNAILTLKNSSNLEEMGLNGYNYAKRHFDRKVIASKYLSLLEEASIRE